MSEENFIHIIKKNLNDTDIKMINTEIDIRAESQTYLFEFGDNGTVYSAAFTGRLRQGDTDGLFRFLHAKLYQDCPRAVRTYLEQKHLKYSDFQMGKVPMTHEEVMERAEILLGSCSPDTVDRHIGNTDYYYGIMDYQKWLDKNRCEGCYYAVKRTSNRRIYSYRIIGQIFSCDRNGCRQEGHFVIRTDNGKRKFHSLAEIYGDPVLPVAGCVDIHGILADIDGIHTTLQALNVAVR